MKRTDLILALLAVAALSACGKSAKPAEPAAETAGTEQTETSVEVAEPARAAPAAEPAAEPAVETKLPPLAVVVTHRVKDFDAWKTGFDGNKDARMQAGIVAHHVNRGVTDPKLVMVYLVATDLEKVKTFMADPALKDVMKQAGVIGKPSIEIVTPVDMHTATDPTLAAALVVHEVKDYDAWKTAFDADAARRTEAGLVGYAVNRDQDKPNLVSIYLQGSTREALEAFLANKDLKKVMKDAGVKGKPAITLVQGVEWVQYAK